MNVTVCPTTRAGRIAASNKGLLETMLKIGFRTRIEVKVLITMSSGFFPLQVMLLSSYLSCVAIPLGSEGFITRLTFALWWAEESSGVFNIAKLNTFT